MNHERTTWLVALFLFVGVLVPTASVVWFINESVQRETAAAHQTVTAAYREQLRLIRGRIDGLWSDRGRLWAEYAQIGGAAAFQRVVLSGGVDSAIIVDDRGVPVYPVPFGAMGNDEELPSPESVAARTAQASIRILLQTKNDAAAVAAIEKHFLDGPEVRGTDPDGHLIAADELLLAAQLLRPSDPRASAISERLVSLLNTYDNSVSIPSLQRIFLMRELNALNSAHPERFPTFAAERLAAKFLDVDSVRSSDAGFHRSRLPDVWTFVPPGGRVVALIRAESIHAALDRVVAQSSSSLVRFSAASPTEPVPDEGVGASALLPDWHIAFVVTDPRPAEAVVRRRVAVTTWLGVITIAVVVGVAIIIGRSLQRQVRVTRLKTDLVAAVSHELKTPLSSMRLLVDSLLDDRDLEGAKTREYLQLIASENLRLSRVIENFLTFSRIERRGLRLTFEPVAPADVVALVVRATRERFPAPRAQLHVETEPSLPSVRGDDHALVMALLNLLDNAYKYTLGDKQIWLRTYREHGAIVFEVQDNGIGISPKEQKRIFRRFYRIDQQATDHRGGSGLGLAIVEFIARSHEGTVTVESTPGVGSTFKLSIPRDVSNGVAA